MTGGGNGTDQSWIESREIGSNDTIGRATAEEYECTTESCRRVVRAAFHRFGDSAAWLGTTAIHVGDLLMTAAGIIAHHARSFALAHVRSKAIGAVCY